MLHEQIPAVPGDVKRLRGQYMGVLPPRQWTEGSSESERARTRTAGPHSSNQTPGSVYLHWLTQQQLKAVDPETLLLLPGLKPLALSDDSSRLLVQFSLFYYYQSILKNISASEICFGLTRQSIISINLLRVCIDWLYIQANNANKLSGFRFSSMKISFLTLFNIMKS